MDKPIGGYFELELPDKDKSFPHCDGVLLNSGRHSLEYILRSLNAIKKLWIPYYTCDAVLQPILRLGIPYSFYHIDYDFTLSEDIIIGQDEYIIYTNYFGIMDAYCHSLAEKYSYHLIIDNAQALFAKPLKGINTFYSPRKYVGVPDGGIAFSNSRFKGTLPKDISFERCSHLLKRHDLIPSEGYNEFRENSRKIADSTMSWMSNLTVKLLSSIDYEQVCERRKKNYTYLNEFLSSTNEFKLPSAGSIACPMVYPYFTKSIGLKKRLIDNNIFVATYWPNVFEWCEECDVEFKLASKIIAIPIDQRYSVEDMNRIIDIIKNESYN